MYLKVVLVLTSIYMNNLCTASEDNGITEDLPVHVPPSCEERGYYDVDGKCCGHVTCGPGSYVVCLKEFDKASCRLCPKGTYQFDATSTHSGHLKKCQPYDCYRGAVPSRVHSWTQNPFACPKYCVCSKEEGWCGHDPCDCRKTKCRYGYEQKDHTCNCYLKTESRTVKQLKPKIETSSMILETIQVSKFITPSPIDQETISRRKTSEEKLIMSTPPNEYSTSVKTGENSVASAVRSTAHPKGPVNLPDAKPNERLKDLLHTKSTKGPEDLPDTKPTEGFENSPDTKPTEGLENLPDTKPIEGLENLPDTKPTEVPEDLPDVLLIKPTVGLKDLPYAKHSEKPDLKPSEPPEELTDTKPSDTEHVKESEDLLNTKPNEGPGDFPDTKPIKEPDGSTKPQPISRVQWSVNQKMSLVMSIITPLLVILICMCRDD